jgi:flavin reductase (DIM6/NTAB) family NADH-FMN oxidoreductase RutF
MIKESGCFTVNFPTRDMVRAVDLCGVISGRDGDKFERAGLTAVPGSAVAAPVVGESPVAIECAVHDIVPLGVHDLFIGRVVARTADPACLTGGKVDFNKIPLICYVNGEYWSLGENLGRYGCSRKL